mmetsp:Transcript_35460/g.111489  ORF Transcript_35460/g.111489 Transcript_35460/m.111489 type:complete len:123 (+) Transcript_35460:319-687(+)
MPSAHVCPAKGGGAGGRASSSDEPSEVAERAAPRPRGRKDAGTQGNVSEICVTESPSDASDRELPEDGGSSAVDSPEAVEGAASRPPCRGDKAAQGGARHPLLRVLHDALLLGCEGRHASST